MMRMLMLTDKGRAALEEGHAVEAYQILKEKHLLVVDYWGENSVFAATSAIDLADACLACGDAVEADKLIEWALMRYRALEVNDGRQLRAEIAWATSAYQSADYVLAEQRFLGLIEHCRAAGAEHDIQRAIAQDYLAQVYLRQSRSEDAEPLLLNSLAIFESDGSDPGAIAVCLCLIAGLQYAGERFREAEHLQRRAIEIYEANADEIGLAKSLDHLGAALAMRAQREQRAELAMEAAQHGERAVAIFQQYLPSNHYSVQGSRQNLAAYRRLSVSIGKMFPSDDDPGDSARMDLPPGHPTAIIHALNDAWRHVQEHDYDKAFALALATRERATHHFGPHSSLAYHAFSIMIGILRRNCSYLLGEPTGTLSPRDHMMMQMRAHTRRGIVEDQTTPTPEMEQEERSKVEHILEKAIEIASDVCGIVPFAETTAYPHHVRRLFRVNDGFASDLLEILHYARWFGVLENRNAAEMAFQVMQLHGEGPAAEGFAGNVRSRSHGAFHRELRERYRLAVLDRDSLVRSLVEAADPKAAASAAALAKQLPEMECVIASLESELNEAGDSSATGAAALPSLAAVQALLRPSEALLAMLVGSRAIFLLAATGDHLTFKRVEMEEGLVRVLCEAVVESATLSEDSPEPDFDLASALQIHDLVLGPVRNVLCQASHLLFMPDGPLWTIPLQCLVFDPVKVWGSEGLTPEPHLSGIDASPEKQDVTDDDNSSSDFQPYRHRLVAFNSWLEDLSSSEALSAITERQLWVADRYAISIMPSLAPLLSRSSISGVEDRRQSFMGFGDPAISRTLYPDLASVPETSQILTSFAAALNADLDRDIITGEAATLDRLVDLSESGDLANRRVICFATHATYPRDDSQLLTEAGLVFSNGELLTAFDVVGLRIDADLVLLTACFTGAPSGRSVTVPLSGLAQAFLKAGARCLLVSHWPIDANATEVFASRFASEMAAGCSLASALRAAEDHVRRQTQFSHPAFWSGFSIVGDGAHMIIPLELQGRQV